MLRIIRLIKTRVEAVKKDPAVRYALRPMRYEAIDGANEIGQGVTLLCFSLSLALYAVVLPVASMWKAAICWLLMICGVLACRCIPKAIKKRITWPRTGYVAYPLDTKPMRIGRVIGFVLMFGLAYMLVRLIMPDVVRSMTLSEMRQHGAISHGAISHGAMSPTLKVLLAGFGVLAVPMYVTCAGGSFRKHPWKWFLLALMVLGPVGITLIVPGGYMERLWPAGLFVGLVFLASGVATLYSYVRHTKPPDPEPE